MAVTSCDLISKVNVVEVEDIYLRRSKKVHSLRIAIVSGTEVTVVGGENSVAVALLYIIRTFPLADTGTASVSKNGSTSLLENVEGVVPFEGSPDLLASGSDEEVNFGLQLA
jgi:hypothetical protein